MRVSNFNAGPAGLPLPVLERARDELLDFEGSGMSIMEHTHRGKVYEAVHGEALSLFAELAGVPATHQVLFMQGGAHAQFALVPMNFMQGRGADYHHKGLAIIAEHVKASLPCTADMRYVLSEMY